MKSDLRHLVPIKLALACLPEKKEIHTFRNPAPNMLLGCDWDREEIVELLIRCAPEIEAAGAAATGMNHGIAIHDDVGVLFIETDILPDELEEKAGQWGTTYESAAAMLRTVGE